MFCLVKWTESAGDCQTTVSVELLLCLVKSSRIELSSRAGGLAKVRGSSRE